MTHFTPMPFNGILRPFTKDDWMSYGGATVPPNAMGCVPYVGGTDLDHCGLQVIADACVVSVLVDEEGKSSEWHLRIAEQEDANAYSYARCLMTARMLQGTISAPLLEGLGFVRIGGDD